MCKPDELRRWIEQAKKGDEKAFGALYAEKRRIVLIRCKALLGDNAADAEDVTQKVFLKVWNDLPTLQNAEAFSGWLNVIVRRTCIDHTRASGYAQAKQSVSLDAPNAEGERLDAADPQQNVEDHVLSNNECQWVLERIETESRNTRPPWDATDWKLFSLHSCQGVPFAEAAKRMSIAESTLKSRYQNRIKPLLDRLYREIRKS